MIYLLFVKIIFLYIFTQKNVNIYTKRKKIKINVIFWQKKKCVIVLKAK